MEIKGGEFIAKSNFPFDIYQISFIFAFAEFLKFTKIGFLSSLFNWGFYFLGGLFDTFRDFGVCGIFTTFTEEKSSKPLTKEPEETSNIDQSYKNYFSSSSCEPLVLSLKICYWCQPSVLVDNNCATTENSMWTNLLT